MGIRRTITRLMLPAFGIICFTLMALAVQNRKVDENALRNAGKSNKEDWLTYGLSPQEQRYSLLKEIDASNVSRLGLVWTYEIGQGGGNQEATPLVSNGVLYSITNWSITFALDARTGKEIWRYDPMVDRAVTQPKICCGNVNRGLAIYQDKIFVPVIDGRLVAVEAATGKEVWSVQTTPPGEDYTMTMAPRVARGKVVVGNAGAEYPVRGFVTAYDANTGKQAWRFYTVPGDPKKGFENKAMEAAAKTWGGEWYKFGGGGTAWDAMAYDPESNLFYFGTGNGGPWPSELRQSRGLDNLYVCSILAVDADTGEYKWHYQVVPEDSWDYDSVQQLTLADIRINGQTRKVLMQANKNGFFYVLDRLTGKLISAEPFAQVNWASGIDLKTGRPIVPPEAFYGRDRNISISPGPGGAHNWSPMSFNPELNLIYIPASTSGSMSYRQADSFEYQAGRINMGTSFGGVPLGAPPRGGPGGPGAGPGAPGAPVAPAGPGGPVGGPAAPPAGRGVPPGAARGGILDPGAAIGAGFNFPGAAPGIPTAPPLPMIGPKDKDGKLYTGSWLIAIDPSTQKEKWRASGGGFGGGTLATAGNLVFQVQSNGTLVAYRADTGDKLFETSTSQTSGMGPPITFVADGKQYVAVAGGTGPRGGFGPAPAGPVPGAGRGAAAVPVLPRLYVYALDGKLANPTPGALPTPPPAPGTPGGPGADLPNQPPPRGGVGGGGGGFGGR